MTLVDEPLPGVKVLKPFIFEDARGCFVKTYHEEQFQKHGISLTLQEEFYSTSSRNVLRGMHFQQPPHAHQKIIYCMKGKVLDVLLDIRKDSPTYGKSIGIDLSEQNRHILFVPIGLAHGFLSLEDHSTLVYKTDSLHNQQSDAGILWDSFGYPWPSGAKQISERDTKHPEFGIFESLF